MRDKLMIQLGSKPSTKQYPHDPQVTEYYSFKSLAMYGRLLFLYLVVLHLNSSTFLGLLLVFTFLLANEKKEFSLFKFLVAKLLQSLSRLCSKVVVLKKRQENS